MKAVLRIENLAKSYHGPQGRVQAVGGVSLSLEAGELTVVQGPSGCGKTTLLLAAGGLLQPDSGRVSIEGRDLGALTAEEQARFRAATVGFVFQQFHLIPYLSVRDNILAPALSCARAGAHDRADHLMARFGLQERAGHMPAQLSTGERQRTALARAMLNRPKLLLADEPTGNLDPANGQLVLGCLREFADSGGAVLLVTHDAALAQNSRCVLRLEGGKPLSRADQTRLEA